METKNEGPVLTFKHEERDFHDSILLNNVPLKDINIDGARDALKKVNKKLGEEYTVSKAAELLNKYIPDTSVACAVAYRMGIVNKKDPTMFYMLFSDDADDSGGIQKSKIAEKLWKKGFINDIADLKFNPEKKLIVFFHMMGQYLYA